MASAEVPPASAAEYLAAEAGIRQFLDIGSGLPTADNAHQIAQRASPAARVAYDDNDLMVVPQWRPDPDTLSERDWPVLQLAWAGVARI